MKRQQGILDMDLYKKTLNEACEAGAKQVSLENYGESFLDPHILERARYAKQRGLEVYTITNGSLLDDKTAEGVVEFFDKIRISMYAVTKNTYETIHRGLSFDVVKENVARLLEMRRKKGSHLRIEMYFLLMKENEDEKDIFIKQYEKIVDALSIWKPHNWGDGRNYRPVMGKKVSCGRPSTGPIQIQWDGMVVPCCFDYDSRIILGDIKRQTLHEILHGERYEELRKAHRNGDFSKFPFCDICDQLHKRNDVLIYTTIRNSIVGATNTTYFDLDKGINE